MKNDKVNVSGINKVNIIDHIITFDLTNTSLRNNSHFEKLANELIMV